MAELKGMKPLLLLDDIFEKLDQDRITALMTLVSQQHFGQIFITDSHPERVTDILGSIDCPYDRFSIEMHQQTNQDWTENGQKKIQRKSGFRSYRFDDEPVWIVGRLQRIPINSGMVGGCGRYGRQPHIIDKNPTRHLLCHDRFSCSSLRVEFPTCRITSTPQWNRGQSISNQRHRFSLIYGFA